MKKKHNQGFSLVELLLAVAILAIIMVALGAFMQSTTGVYNRTSNNIEVQQDSQNLYDLIADKLMQAKEVRIGGGGKQFALTGSSYTFSDMTSASPIDVTYICIYYDAEVSGTYGAVVDTFYFYDGAIYMKRVTGSARASSVYTADNDSAKVSVNVTSTDDEIDTLMNNSIAYVYSASSNPANLEADLVCENVNAMKMYAIPDENALFMSITMEKKGISNTSQGIITIRNSYVLAPKHPATDSSTDTSTSTEAGAGTSTEASGI